jgi:hypothetical protein
MKSTRCLIVTCGFFGDIMFASSLAKKLKSKYDEIDYLIGFPQMQRLMQNNPYIRTVYVSQHPGPNPYNQSIDRSVYDRVIELHPLNYLVTPCEEYQDIPGIEYPTSDYELYTQPEYDVVAEQLINDLHVEHGKLVIGVMGNWEPKTYIFTEEQYKLGIDVPNLGYGGSHRNIQLIISELEKHFTLIPIGVGQLNQQQTVSIPDDDTKSVLFEASLMKYCDAFIGAEGGLCNLAAGVGCKTIITGDFVHQLYGWNGVLKKIENPKLGPIHYFKNAGHIELDPYLTDTEVAQEIINALIKQ